LLRSIEAQKMIRLSLLPSKQRFEGDERLFRRVTSRSQRCG